MKTIILTMVIILMMTGTVFAGDPNSMPNPTPRTPVTICIQEKTGPPAGGIVTIKMWVDKDGLSVASKPSFVNDVKNQWYRGLTNLAAVMRKNYMNDIHMDDSLDYLEELAELEKEKRKAERIQ